MKQLMTACVFVGFVSAVGSAHADVQWDLNATVGNTLWSSPGNWMNADGLPRYAPTLADEVLIDVPSAAAPNGPVIQDGDTAQALGIFTEAAGEPTLTMTGGTLEVADWVWWGDGPDSFAIWYMQGGEVTVVNEFELGWGGGGGTLEMTGGSITAGRFRLPASEGAFSQANLHGGTFTVTNEGQLDFWDTDPPTYPGKMDFAGSGMLILEGDDTAKIADLIASGQITADGGTGTVLYDWDTTNAGKTTVYAQVSILLGDVNGDGEVNGLDVDPFVDVLLNGPYQVEADMNEDLEVNGLDVDPFVAAVVGGGTQAVPEPSTIVLTGLALLGLVWYRRRS